MSTAADIDNKEKDKSIATKIINKDDTDKSTVLELLEEDDEFEVFVLYNYIVIIILLTIIDRNLKI